MQITVRQTGGFAGVPVDLASVDTSALAPARAERLEQAVRQAGFFDLPATLQGSVGADLARYEVTVVDGSRQHTVSFEQNDTSAAAVPLHKLVDEALQSR